VRDRRFRSYFRHDSDGSLAGEYDATMCGHGGEIIILTPDGKTNWTQWDFCLKCMKPICPHCAAVMAKLKGECVVFERQLRAREVILEMRRRTGLTDTPAQTITGLRDRVMEISEDSLREMREKAIILDINGWEAHKSAVREREFLEAHLDTSI
jgi:hypothetical protein